MAITTLELGPVGNPIYTFKDEDASLFSAQYTMGLDVIGVRLTVDTSTCIVNYPFGLGSAQPMAGLDFSCITSSDGYVMCSNKVFPNLKNIPNGTEARLYRRGKLFMKLYKKNANKITPTKFSLSLISSIGIFEDQKHAGGFYNGVAFASVVEEIIDGAVPYTMEDDVADLLVRGGYLPRQSKRENLHWLCFAYTSAAGEDAERNKLARAVLARMAEAGVELQEDGLAHNGYTVLTKTTAPAILVEYGFHTNKEDVERLKDPAYREQLAMATAQGICDYLGVEWQMGGEDPAPWYEEARQWAMDMGITDGTRPEELCTRAEVWEMLKRHTEALSGSGEER